MMRRFLVQRWGIDSFIVIWCKGVKCTDCRLRFDCWTRHEDFVLTRTKNTINTYEFKGNSLGAWLGVRVETVVEYLIAGNVPTGQQNQGWVYQAGCKCPDITPRHVLASDNNFNRELKLILFPCKLHSFARQLTDIKEIYVTFLRRHNW